MTGVAFDAIVLAGGRSSRARTAKLELTSAGRPLLAYAIDAVTAAVHVVVVGPVAPDLAVRDVLWRQEDPPFGGPMAAVAAAVPDLRCAVVVLLAGDVPGAGPAVPHLLAALDADLDASVLVDAGGVRQPLLAAYRTDWLRERVAAGGTAARSLLDGARCAEVEDRWGAARDLDTPADARDLGFGAAPRG